MKPGASILPRVFIKLDLWRVLCRYSFFWVCTPRACVNSDKLQLILKNMPKRIMTQQQALAVLEDSRFVRASFAWV